MLIDFQEICKKYSKPNGIIHMGAHLAEEIDAYNLQNIKNILWIEANPFIFEKLKQKTDKYNHKALLALLSDKDDEDINLNITLNLHDGTSQSSSVLEFGSHIFHHPHVVNDKSISLKSKTLSSLIVENNLDAKDYNFLNIDLQGYEMNALIGYEQNLKYVDYIYTEVNQEEVYRKCTKINELDEYLNKFNFVRYECSMTPYGWGDALYARK